MRKFFRRNKEVERSVEHNELFLGHIHHMKDARMKYKAYSDVRKDEKVSDNTVEYLKKALVNEFIKK